MLSAKRMSNCWRESVLFCIVTSLACAATVKGKITEDHSGSPVASASVRIAKVGVRGLQADLETDGEGRFEAAELTEGDYRVDISKPNFLNATVRLRLTVDGSSANVRLIRCGVIAGRVTDSAGKPVQAAKVLALRTPANGYPLRPDFNSGHSATVDARGNYRIFDLPPGQYAVAVSYGASTYAIGSSGSPATAPSLGSGFLFYPDNAHPQFLTIDEGEERRGLDFAVRTSALYSVSGKVELPTPKAIFWLALIALDQPALAVAVSQSSPDGGFRFSGVPAGSYHLVASKTNGSRNSSGGFLDDDPVFARTRVDIVTQDVTDVVVAPQKGRSAALVMHVAKSSEPASACPTAAQVVLKPLEDWGVVLDRRTSLNLDKQETVSAVAPARYFVSVTGLGESCYATEDPILDLSGGADAGLVTVTIAPAGSIRGRLDTGGQTAADFAVVLIPVETNLGEAAVQVAHPDSESRFSFASLPPGRYRLATQLRSETSQARWLSEPERMVEVEVHGGKPADVNLNAPPSKP
jgi:hypothetical protein